jgi:hypothetical protein
MGALKKRDVIGLGTIFWIWGVIFPGNAAAYVDPGTTGMLSQILYVLFYGAVGVFFYCLRSITKYINSLKGYLAKCLGRKS